MMTGTETLARSSIYGLLAHLMLGKWDQLKQELASQQNEFAMLSEDLQSLLQRLIQTDSFALKLEYDNLFLVPGKYYAPPFERVYQEEGNLEELYEQLGFSLPEEIGETPDHIGCELAFMQTLVLAEHTADDNGNREHVEFWRQLQTQFLHEHLAKWIPQFRAKVQEKEPNSFYEQVVMFMESFVLSETSN